MESCLATMAVICGLSFTTPGGVTSEPVVKEPVKTTQTKEKAKPSRRRARLLPNGRMILPQSAPPRVKRVVAAANRIRFKPYVWGGGHSSFRASGYDCSGAVSFALRGGRFLERPLTSGSLASWGKAGKGRWITVYANAGHTFAKVAGFRWDTSGGPGPRWHKDSRSHGGFAMRHPIGF